MTPERAIEVLGGVRANAASLASGIPGYRYGGESGVDVANACTTAIYALEGCEDWINRDEAIYAINKVLEPYAPSILTGYTYKIPLDCALALTRLPSVIPQRKRGRWRSIENEDMKIVAYYCSECDLPMETEKRTMYCPNCGARMTKSEDKE